MYKEHAQVLSFRALRLHFFRQFLHYLVCPNIKRLDFYEFYIFSLYVFKNRKYDLCILHFLVSLTHGFINVTRGRITWILCGFLKKEICRTTNLKSITHELNINLFSRFLQVINLGNIMRRKQC